MNEQLDSKNTESKPELYTVLCAVLTFLNLKFNITQYRWGRKLYRGTWYYIDPKGLSMCAFWSDTEITSCQSQTLRIELY